MSRMPVQASDEVFEALRQHFPDAQLVELTFLIALENLRGGLNAALGTDLQRGMACTAPATTTTQQGGTR
jgi:alkylhydroperoxidase family enzyme